ncbi:hypothetical protein [Spiroplasma endosymbiont of Lasioglossum villosulum]|uniref:hypothetical protein n=1 Tax=Spiroplasma endosymbiont of Lasioglossum villosulum TaxID=3066320 RepID=UPI0030CF2CEB
MNVLLLNIIGGVLILITFLLITVFDYKDNKKKIKQINFICLSGIMLALAVSLNTTGALMLKSLPFSKYFEIKLGNFILVLIGFFCGGILGFLSGIASDFLGLLFSTSGASPCLFFTFTSILWCILPYYLVLNFSKIYYSKKTFYWYLPIAYAITSLIITGTDPIALKILFPGLPPLWLMYFPLRVIKYPIDLTVNVFLIVTCYSALKKTLNLENQFKKYYFATDPQFLQYNRVPEA